jgi:NAD(P)H-flavin reductase
LKRFNPVAFVFRTSHEHINRWHRVLGYITYLFIVLHGIFYLNYYIQIGDMPDALLRAVPVLGLIGLFFMTMLSTTALSLVRQYSYRVFYLAHLFVALAMPPLIWLHVHHSRVFMTESFLILIFGMVVRRYGIVKTGAAIEVHHGTDLIKVVATIPSKKLQQFAAHPASHVYLSIPAETRPDPNPLSWSYLRFIFTSNPFTVAEFNEEASEITLVARQMRGPVTGVLSRLTSLQSSGDKFAINVDGPYGTASNFLEIAGTNFDQILLVAGGVGATFILPLYRHILATNPSAQVQVVWSARTSDEMTWPVLSGQDDLLKDDRVHLFVTRNKTHTGVDTNHSSGSDDVELSQLELDKAESQNTRIPVANHRRPDIQAIVDGVFRQKPHHRVAVVVCGPVAMARDLRKAVGVWVNSGSDVWFHNESFGC